MPEDPQASANHSPAEASAASTASPDTPAVRSTRPAQEVSTLEVSSPEVSNPSDFNLEYAPAPESTDILRLKDSYGLFINGELGEPGDSAIPSTNPATGEHIADFTLAEQADIDRAVVAARRAFEETWQPMPPSERAKYLFRIARLLAERSREFAVLESLDGGKPIKESRDVDIPLASAHFFYNAGWADKLDYAFVGHTAKPVGVVGAIIPWSFPMLMAAWKLAPALACGNTVVLKPAETTPLTALLFTEILQDAGLPPGVVNILTGGPDAGARTSGGGGGGEAETASQHFESRRPARQEHRPRGHQLGTPTRENPLAGGIGSRRRSEPVSARLPAPREGSVLPPQSLHRSVAVAPHRP